MNLIEFMRSVKKNDGCDETLEFNSTNSKNIVLNRVIGLERKDYTSISIPSNIEIPEDFDSCWNMAKESKNYFLPKENVRGFELTV